MKRTAAVCGMGLAAGFAFLAAEPATANNMTVTNVVLTNQDLVNKAVDVRFDLSWSNSWVTDTNWDAAWVFVKFIAPGSNNWQHALLSTNSADHTPAANSTITPTADGVGAFVYSSLSAYTGGVSYTSMRLHWNYGANGYDFAKGAALSVAVQAIEMVYVAAGPFTVGDGLSDSSQFQSTLITTNDASQAGGYPSGQTAANALWPNGYNAFYCMKYDITQGQYCRFLNMLTRAQQNHRIYSVTPAAGYFAMSGASAIGTSFRNGIRCPAVIPGAPTNIVFGCDANGNGTFDQPDDGMDRACNYLSWSDGAAYAAWAGLRPMTELEYEKACRGPLPPVAGEYAWGNTTLTNLSSEVNDGTGTSTANPATANCLVVHGLQGPCRVGIFETANSSRQSAGASYWGIMDLSGNVNQRPVTIGSANGRAFTGSHGNGILDTKGRATNTNWNTDGEGYDGSGSGLRGSCFGGLATVARVSDRSYAASGRAYRNYYMGWRAVRRAP